MRVALLVLSSACVAAVVDEDSNDIVNEVIRYLLDFKHVPNANSSAPSLRASHRSAAEMQSIYESFVGDDGSDDGNVVRGIDPGIGKLDGHEVLIYDITGLEKEQIMRGELHFFLRRRDAVKSGRTRQLRAKSLCINEYCSENQQLETISVSSDKVIWDATKPLAEANALRATQLVIRISRRDIRMRRYVELVKKCSPFLLIYSRAENTIDTGLIQERVESTRRNRREAGYFSYNSMETTSQAYTTTGHTSRPTRPYRKHFAGRSFVHKGNRARKSRSKSQSEDVWSGFGEESSDEKDSKTVAEKSNDVRVVLLGAEEKRATCQKRNLVFDLKSFGWGRWIIAPAIFEPGFCSGTCTTPLLKDVNPSNHAFLQILLKHPSVPPLCCSPQGMRSLTIFYRDEIGRATVRNFDSMVVDSCACQ